MEKNYDECKKAVELLKSGIEHKEYLGFKLRDVMGNPIEENQVREEIDFHDKEINRRIKELLKSCKCRIEKH